MNNNLDYESILKNLEKQKEECEENLSILKKRYYFFYRTGSNEETRLTLENSIDIMEEKIKLLKDQIEIIRLKINKNDKSII